MTLDRSCYGCGQAFSPEALALIDQLELEGETPELVDQLNAASREHEGCF
jgi:hypothetical protein